MPIAAAIGLGAPISSQPPSESPWLHGVAPSDPRVGHDLPDWHRDWRDGSNWQIWWQLNRDRFVGLRHAVLYPPEPAWMAQGFDCFSVEGAATASRGPTNRMISDYIAPALRNALRQSEDEDLRSTALIALGRCDRSASVDESLDLMRESLRCPSQIVRESAALALGLIGRPEVVGELLTLANEKPIPDATVDGGPSLRTRCFAVYALGILASNSEVTLRRRVVIALERLLERPPGEVFDLPIAASHAIRLATQDLDSASPRFLAADALRSSWVEDEANAQEGESYDILCAHRTNALALGVVQNQWQRGTPTDRRLAAELLLPLIESEGEPGSAAALALGLLDARQTTPQLLTSLDQAPRDDEYYASRSIALGMLGHEEAIEPLRALMDASSRRDDRKLGTAQGLALLGDTTLSDRLLRYTPDLDRPTSLDTASSLRCLLDVGDRFAVSQLVEWPNDDDLEPALRARAAAALGGIAEPGEQRWDMRLRANLTCSGMVPTLSPYGGGVLDRL